MRCRCERIVNACRCLNCAVRYSNCRYCNWLFASTGWTIAHGIAMQHCTPNQHDTDHLWWSVRGMPNEGTWPGNPDPAPPAMASRSSLLQITEKNEMQVRPRGRERGVNTAAGLDRDNRPAADAVDHVLHLGVGLRVHLRKQNRGTASNRRVRTVLNRSGSGSEGEQAEARRTRASRTRHSPAP